MARRVQYTDEMIIEAACRVKAAGKNLNPWAVRTELGGGKPNRIEQVLNNPEYELKVIDAEPVTEQELLTLPSQFSSRVQQIQDAMHNAACEMWRTASEMADNRVKDEFLSAKKAKETAEFELAEAREAVDRQEDELDTLDAELDSIKKVCSQRESELKDAGRQIAASEAEIKSLKSQLTELRDENKQLEKELETEQQAVSEMRGELKAKDQQLSEIAAENKGLEQESGKLKTELANAVEANKATITRLEQETQALKQIRNENKDITGQSTKLKTTVAGLEARVDDRNTKILQLEKENKALQECKQKVAEIKAEHKASQARVRELSQESGALKQENKELHKQIGGLQAKVEKGE